MMISGSALFALGFLYCNEHKLHPSVTGFVRGFTVAILCWLISRRQNTELTFRSNYGFKWQLLRNGIMVMHGLIYAWTQFYLPFPIVIILNSASPIFAVMFNRILYGVRVNKIQVGCLGLAFVGVVFTANGTYL
jgi:drug/metabolite transporter (DMT)-like permease